jgi:hypothetical protein
MYGSIKYELFQEYVHVLFSFPVLMEQDFYILSTLKPLYEAFRMGTGRKNMYCSTVPRFFGRAGGNEKNQKGERCFASGQKSNPVKEKKSPRPPLSIFYRTIEQRHIYMSSISRNPLKHYVEIDLLDKFLF